MKKFEKLSRNEMKNVKGGQLTPPPCAMGQVMAVCTTGVITHDPNCGENCISTTSTTSCQSTPLPSDCYHA